MYYQQSVDGCINQKASGKAALGRMTEEAWLARLERLEPAIAGLRRAYRDNTLPLLHICEQRKDLLEAGYLLARARSFASTLVVLGTGGSSLGAQTLVEALPGRGGMDVKFFHNLDAAALQDAMAGLELHKCVFVAISKSGNTAETLAQSLYVLDALREGGLGHALARHFFAITETGRKGTGNALLRLCRLYNLPVLPHDRGIGGRYSVFTVVGLLPAMAAGLDAVAIREGGQSVIANLLGAESASEMAAAQGAAVSAGLLEDRGIVATAMMPYAERLKKFSFWFAQLWAESLGKAQKGSIPIPVVGPADQHSILQLFLDGPPVFLMNLVRVENGPDQAACEPEINPMLARLAGADYLAGRRVSELVTAQHHAIRDNFAQVGRPLRSITLARLDERCLGALMMHFMLETILTAHLLKVDPFNQPAVELGKVLTRQYLAAGSAEKAPEAEMPGKKTVAA